MEINRKNLQHLKALNDQLRNELLGLRVVGNVLPSVTIAEILGTQMEPQELHGWLCISLQQWEQDLDEQENFEQETLAKATERGLDVLQEQSAERGETPDENDGAPDELPPPTELPSHEHTFEQSLPGIAREDFPDNRDEPEAPDIPPKGSHIRDWLK